MKELREKYKKQSIDYDQETTEHGFRNWLRSSNLESSRPISETEKMDHNRHNDKIGSLGMRMLVPVATLGAIAGIAYLNRGIGANLANRARHGDRVVRDFFGNPVQGNDLNPEASSHLLSSMGYRGESHRDMPQDLEVGIPSHYRQDLMAEEDGGLRHRHNPKHKKMYENIDEEDYYL